MVARTSGGMPHIPAGGGCIAPPMSPCPSARMSIKLLRSSANARARRRARLSKGGASRLTKRLVLALLGSTSQAACSAWHRVFDTVKIGPFRLPVSRIAGEPDALVCLELDKFEEAG